MSILTKILTALCCVFLLTGCYEDESELTLNPDGSGTLKQKLVMSERAVVAASEGDDNGDMPPVTKEKMLETIGSALNVTSFKQTDLPDGGRIIEFEGTFKTPQQFFLSEFCRDTLELRLAPAANGKAVIYSDAWQSSSDLSGPSITQLYGLAKGLYIKRTVRLPGKIGKTNGLPGKDKNTASWVTDLRNKQALARTKAFIEGKDKGIGSAVFDASALTFALPLKSAAAKEKITKDQTQPSPQQSSNLKAEVAWVALNKKNITDSNNRQPELSDLEFGIKVSWDANTAPYACHTPVITNIQDDLGGYLGKATYQNVFEIFGSKTEKELKIKAKTPALKAKKIKNLQGYVPVVTSVKKEKVTLKNMQALAGKETTGNPILDKLNFKIISTKGSHLKIEIDGGNDTIISLKVFSEDGSEIKSQGSSGWANKYSYGFADDISKLNTCELEVVVSQTIVKIPFSTEELVLP
jgi:hypothetical protein